MTDKPVDRPDSQPAEHLDTRPGKQADMQQQPHSRNPTHVGSGKLRGKVALITGGDSGIGRAVAVDYAREGANIAIIYLEEHEDATETERLVAAEGGKCLVIAGDIGDESFCKVAVQ